MWSRHIYLFVILSLFTSFPFYSSTHNSLLFFLFRFLATFFAVMHRFIHSYIQTPFFRFAFDSFLESPASLRLISLSSQAILLPFYCGTKASFPHPHPSLQYLPIPPFTSFPSSLGFRGVCFHSFFPFFLSDLFFSALCFSPYLSLLSLYSSAPLCPSLSLSLHTSLCYVVFLNVVLCYR